MPLFFGDAGSGFFQRGDTLAEVLMYLMDGAGGLGLFCYFSTLLIIVYNKGR